MTFSGTVKLTNLDDFIAPAQDCVKPLIDKKKAAAEAPLVRVREKKTEPVKITLNDCLACSGCVTSAEAVLIQEQSTAELQKALAEGSRVVLSVSPQSRASLAVEHGLSVPELDRRLLPILRKLGVSLVLDSNFGRQLSILACQEEYLRWRKEKGPGHVLLSSICPGWVCYAEKSVEGLLVPHLSRAASPQAIMGSLVKDWLVDKLGWALSDVYHVAVMPCFDKKLEATRHRLPDTDIRTVDCVISTGELELFLREASCSLDEEVPAESNLEPNASLPRGLELRPDGESRSAGSASGGYAHHVARAAAAALGVGGQELLFRRTWNADMEELVLESAEGEPLARVAVLNGFRNIQKLVQRLKKGKAEFDYIELMACPQGCLNGGGQVSRESIVARKEILLKVKDAYAALPLGSAPEKDPEMLSLIEGWLGGLESEKAAQVLQLPPFKAVEAVDMAGIRW